MFFRNALTTILLALTVVTAAVAGLTISILRSSTEAVEQDQYALMGKIIEFNLSTAEDKAIARAEMIVNLPRIQELFNRGDRDGLAAELKTMFEIQRDKYSVAQSQFHLAPASSFLRLHQPANFGDDLSTTRPIVVSVNKDGVARKGLSISKSGPGIFGVVPVPNGGAASKGTFEFGLEFGGVLDRVKTAYGLETVLFIDEARLKLSAPDLGGEVYSEKNRVGKYIKYSSTNWELMKQLVNDTELSQPGFEKEPYQRDANGNPYGIVGTLLRNPAGDVLGIIVTAKDFSSTRDSVASSTIYVILAAAFGLIISAGIVIVVIRGGIARPLASLSRGYQDLAAGEQGDEGSAELDKSRYYGQLRDIAESYHTLASRDRAASAGTPR